MRKNEIGLPPPKVLQGMLRSITERLATDLARPADLAPDWSDIEWQVARAVAALHGVSPLLSIKLKWAGPREWTAFLETQKAHVASRHRRIHELLSRVDVRAREEDLAVVGLKGVALHAMGLYRPGERPMADVDLLVQPRDSQRACQVLESLGFHELFSNWKHKVFVPEVRNTHADIGEHEQNYLKIELHERISEILPLRTTDVTESVFPRRPHPGLNAYPSKAALMIHLLIHAASAMAYRALRLLHMHDIALVSARMSPSDWEELLTQGHIGRTAGGGPWWALPPLQLTARYFDAVVPPEVLGELSNHCQWTLRRIARHRTLSDVSMSYMWIEAFPGIGWSRSVSEMMEYITSRIRPDKEMLDLRKILAETHVAVAQSQWGRLSQGQRMLRWVMTRQIRADTLHAVRTALGQPQ